MRIFRLPSLIGWIPLSVAIGLLIGACSTQDIVNVALSKNPEQAIESIARGRAESYKRDPRLLVKDAKRAQQQFKKLVAFLSGEVGDTWGEDEVVVPGNKRYVKYTQAYKSRAIVNFDTGVILVETVDQKNPLRQLEQAVITTLLTPEDPRAVDLYSDKPIELAGRPYLQGLVKNQKGRRIEDSMAAESYARYLVGKSVKTRQTKSNEAVRFVRMEMVRDRSHRQASRYLPYVNKHSNRYGSFCG